VFSGLLEANTNGEPSWLNDPKSADAGAGALAMQIAEEALRSSKCRGKSRSTMTARRNR
jgi:hypothetical protein